MVAKKFFHDLRKAALPRGRVGCVWVGRGPRSAEAQSILGRNYGHFCGITSHQGRLVAITEIGEVFTSDDSTGAGGGSPATPSTA